MTERDEGDRRQRGPGRLELSAPPEPEILDHVHDLMEELWQLHPEVPPTDRGRFETAVIEILANIVEHAFELDGGDVESRRFDVVLTVAEDEVRGVLRDNGVPAEIDLSAVTMPDFEAESGRGLALALASLDDLSYERVDGRNRWTLVCRLGERG